MIDIIMEDCIFCAIVDGRQKAYQVFENDLFLGFLDIFPVVKGHTLIIPKKHYRWVYEVPEFTEYWNAVHQVTGALIHTLKPAWLNYFTYGAVPHAHIHILPRMHAFSEAEENDIVPKTVLKFSDTEFSELAESILSHY